MSALGKALRAKREAEEMTLREAGHITGVCYATLSRVENGYEPTKEIRTTLTEWIGEAVPELGARPTLRDQFAMAAITGFCSMADNTGMWSWQPKEMALMAYEVADAMMEARS